MADKKPNTTRTESDALKHNPFAALAGRTAPSQPAAPAQAAPPAPEKASKGPGRVLLRRETKHRGGKAVIVIGGFDRARGHDTASIEALAKQLKQALGCGGTVEESGGSPEIVLQGDKPAKVAELLRAQGFRVDGVTK